MERDKIIKRLTTALEKQIETGFDSRHPTIHQNLKDKIEYLKTGSKYSIYDYKKSNTETIDLNRENNIIYDLGKVVTNSQMWCKNSKGGIEEYFKDLKGNIKIK